MDIKSISFNDFNQRVKSNEGIVLLGAGGDHQEWIDGVVEIWDEEDITKRDDKNVSTDPQTIFSDAYLLTTSGGRTDLALQFSNSEKLNVSKMAMWRIKFGDCSWISDYVSNYGHQF